MSWLKMIWALLFRLFPCPTAVGLRRVGNPGRDSPVLVTCNFFLTVERLTRTLQRAGVDAWLLVADSRGVNVWCAAGAQVFNARSVVSAVKTSGVEREVDHRQLLLPPLGAPGIRAAEVSQQTGWETRWGPVRAADLPAVLASGELDEDHQRRATYGLAERLDTALGSLFPFYLAGAAGFAALGPDLLHSYLLLGALVFVVFFSACPWLPGRRGLTKAMSLATLPVAVLTASYLPFGAPLGPFRPELVLSVVLLLLWGGELGGLSSTLPSEFDAILARLGIRKIGNTSFAGTLRADLLSGCRRLTCDSERCIGCGGCVDICPQGVWELRADKRARMAHRERCTACRACLFQCPVGAIQSPPVTPPVAKKS